MTGIGQVRLDLPGWGRIHHSARSYTWAGLDVCISYRKAKRCLYERTDDL